MLGVCDRQFVLVLSRLQIGKQTTSFLLGFVRLIVVSVSGDQVQAQRIASERVIGLRPGDGAYRLEQLGKRFVVFAVIEVIVAPGGSGQIGPVDGVGMRGKVVQRIQFGKRSVELGLFAEEVDKARAGLQGVSARRAFVVFVQGKRLSALGFGIRHQFDCAEQRGQAGVNGRFGRRVVGELAGHAILRGGEHVFQRRGRAFRRNERVGLADQILIQKTVERVGALKFVLSLIVRLLRIVARSFRLAVEPGHGKHAEYQCGDEPEQVRTPRAAARQGLLRQPALRFQLRLARGMFTALIDIAQAFGQIRRAGQAAHRIAFGRGANVLAQQRIADILFPAGGHRLGQIAGEQLIEQDAERIDVALHGR